ncbi:MAG TPA: cell division protein MukB, partial [Lachnospiraceae bacterium]|nr:cell division protein MukB [Lachnospiraceae bacterium]
LREKEKLQRLDNSLANKVATDNPLARDYINYLLGHVVCCAHVGQLREHRTAITQEGMLFQGYVARPLRRQQMEDAFIGRKAVQIRIRRLEAELQMVRKELQEILPVYQFLDGTKDHEYIFNAVFLEQISQCRKDYLRGLEINTELDRLDEELAGLDLFWLDARRAEMKELQAEIDELRTQTKKTGQEIGALQEKVRALEFEILPAKEKGLKEKEDSLQERFTEDFVQRIGLPRYALELRRLKRAATVAENFGRRLSQSDAEQRNAREKLIRARTVYVQSYQPCSYVIDAPHNEEFAEKLAILEESELPQYREKIRKARESALEQFQNDFLYKLQSSIKQVQDQVRNLNKALKYAQFGSEQYQFRADRNPDYAEYYDMIMAPELMEGEGGLFTWEFQEKYSTLIEDLFNRIAISDDTQLNARRQSELQQNIERYTDFRTYLKFDLETTDREGNRQLLSQTLNKKSGGETQTPFYIAVLASFAQLYQVNNHSSGISNTVRLVVFDEAFNKMDSDRIVESIHLLRKMQLQAIICTPPDKIADIMPLADRTLLVHKGKRSMRILPWSKETE